MSTTDNSAINPDIVTTQIPALDIPAKTLEDFSFLEKAETENPAYQLLSSGALTGYLIAEQINAIRDIVSGLLNIHQTQIQPKVNTLINNPNHIGNIINDEFYHIFEDIKNNIPAMMCDFTLSGSELAVDNILNFPDILHVTITEENNSIYFPFIKMYEINKTSPGISIKAFPTDKVVTFEIWIELATQTSTSISTVYLPSNQYLLLDNENAFPSQLLNIAEDPVNQSTVYVFPVRISNLRNRIYPDVQISYAYNFIAGFNKANDSTSDTAIKHKA